MRGAIAIALIALVCVLSTSEKKQDELRQLEIKKTKLEIEKLEVEIGFYREQIASVE